MNLNVILSSAVIAAIVSGVVALIKHNSSQVSKYIVEQREMWREKIREIATSILINDNIDKTLSELKTRINPYGRFIKKPSLKNTQGYSKRKKKQAENEYEEEMYEYYLKDGHIWNCITEIEKNNNETSKNKLFDHLSSLLKYDWERSKNEVYINSRFVVSLVLCISSIIMLLSYYICNNSLNYSNIIFLIVMAVMFALPDFIHYISDGVKTRDTINASRATAFILIMFLIFTAIISFSDKDIILWSFMIYICSLIVKFFYYENKNSFVKNFKKQCEEIENLYASAPKKVIATEKGIENSNATMKEE